NWYFWAREHATFPKDTPLDSDGKPSLAIIRLLTRLIFCWFLREKRNPETRAGLIPDDLFEPQRIVKLLKNPEPEAFTYYTGILRSQSKCELMVFRAIRRNSQRCQIFFSTGRRNR